RQSEFVQLRVIGRGIRPHFCLGKTCRFRICVRIKYRHRQRVAASPKAETAHLLRVRLARDRIRQMRNATRMWRRRPTGKTGDCEIEASPEKMNRAAFSA